MFLVRHDGRDVRTDDLSLGAIDALERETGRQWHELLTTPRGLAAIAFALVGDAGKHLTPEAAADDRPVEYADGIPSMGGRTADRFVVMFGRPPWCWPPDVTLRQTLRHLLVLSESLDEGD